MSENLVEKQYAKWIYPIPVEDMKEAIENKTYIEWGDPRTSWPIYWPRKRACPEKLDILVAGCGTNQGAYYACRFPEAQITAVDLSETSLGHEKKLKEKHGLDNLELRHLNLTEIKSLGKDYDYIVSSGVLHHLPNPIDGFKALNEVLRPEGVMHCMVYGTSLRLGVYLMQDLFRTCGLEQNPEDVQLVKETLAALPKDHVVLKYSNVAPDLKWEAGIVDTFLHRQDKSFLIPELFSVFQGAGFDFLGWLDNMEYSLETVLPSNHPLWIKLKKLNFMEKSHAYELIAQNKGTHRFAIAHQDYVQKNAIPFGKPELLDCTLIFKNGMKILSQSNAAQQTPAQCERRGLKFTIDWRMSLLISKLEGGKKSLRQAIGELNVQEEVKDEFEKFVIDGVENLWKIGQVFVLLPENENS